MNLSGGKRLPLLQLMMQYLFANARPWSCCIFRHCIGIRYIFSCCGSSHFRLLISEESRNAKQQGVSVSEATSLAKSEESGDFGGLHCHLVEKYSKNVGLCILNSNCCSCVPFI